MAVAKKHPLAGKTLTRDIYISLNKWQQENLDFDLANGIDVDFTVFGFDPSSGDPDYLLVGKTSVTFKVPDDFDPVPGMVASIEAQKKQLTAEFTARVADLNRRLSELQAIDYVPEAA